MNPLKITTITIGIFLLAGCVNSISSFFMQKRYLKQTGQNIIYTDNDDAFYKYGKKPSFTKVNNRIKDNITNLTWQDTNITKTKKLSQNKAISYCANLKLDKYDDWRLPSMKELLTLVYYAKARSSIDDIFINTSSSHYWSSTPYKSDNSLAWGIDFKYGNDFHKNIDDSLNIRCVRGDTIIKSKFQRKNNIVKDIITNLQFQDDDNSKIKKKSFVNAIQYCENLSLGGYNNWRLPNIKELLSIADKDSNPAINSIFKNISLVWLYWSSTTDGGSDDFARAVWFKNGGDWIYAKSSLNFTKCVRNKI